jgi:hypothetical protein
VELRCLVCRDLSARESKALREAAERYGEHIGTPVQVSIVVEGSALR